MASVRKRLQWPIVIEIAAVLVSPAALFYVLRMRPMAPNDLPDPGLHTAYIVHSRDLFMRYLDVLTPTARMREGYRISFLAPAQLFYKMFGAVPGFFVTRYLFVLITIAPTYLLLRRLYGRPAGALGVILVLSSPVFIVTWGTDFPDSALISYATGALACMAMPSSDRWRRAWLALGATLYTLGVWAFGLGVFLAIPAVVGLVAVGLRRDRGRVLGDIFVLAGTALVVTGLLSVISEVMFGRFDFIRPTLDSARYLSQPARVRFSHSTSWRWAPYLTYLLVPPAVLAAWAIVFIKRRSRIPTPQLIVGVIFALQLLLYVGEQFLGTTQTLEIHYFSSTIWSAVCLTLAITLAEIAQPLFAASRVMRWLPAALLLAIPLIYETNPHVPAFGWGPWGYLLMAVLVLASCLPRLRARFAAGKNAWASAAGMVVVAGCALVLTVAPSPRHHHLPGTSVENRPPDYQSALGGKASFEFDEYHVATELPSFVGSATYKNEDLLLWWDAQPILWAPATQYHIGSNTVVSKPPVLSSKARDQLDTRRPAELLLFNPSDKRFPASVNALKRAGYQPVVLRRTVLRSGRIVMYAWLIRLDAFYRGAR
jgi:MFS family permease